MKKTLIDSGPLIALFDASDKHHAKAVNFIKDNKSPLVTTIASITETLHLLDFNRNAQIDFLEWVSQGAVEIQTIENADIGRIKELTVKYRDLPIDFADAACHVTSLGNGRADVFLGDDRQRLLGQLVHPLQLTVSRHFGVDPGVLSSHGHHAGPAKAVAVIVASRLAEATGRQIGLHYGIGSSAVRAIHRRLAERPEALKVVESLVQQLRSKKVKYKV